MVDSLFRVTFVSLLDDLLLVPWWWWNGTWFGFGFWSFYDLKSFGTFCLLNLKVLWICYLNCILLYFIFFKSCFSSLRFVSGFVVLWSWNETWFGVFYDLIFFFKISCLLILRFWSIYKASAFHDYGLWYGVDLRLTKNVIITIKSYLRKS